MKAFYYEVMTPSLHTAPSGSPYETAPTRRQFLGLSLGWLLFWRKRHHRTLAGIRFRVLRNDHAPRRYLLIHGNEETAREVLTEHLKRFKGTALLVENHTRNVTVDNGELDPNRMFSRAGAEKNLRALNPAWPETRMEQMLRKLDRHRHELIEAVEPRGGDALIVIHNNSEGYNVREELSISNRVALNDASNPHEFCLCTDERDFERLSHGPYNVVLQNRPAGADDGSLSRYAASKGFRYVNLEAALGQYDKQKAMLDWVDNTLQRA